LDAQQHVLHGQQVFGWSGFPVSERRSLVSFAGLAYSGSPISKELCGFQTSPSVIGRDVVDGTCSGLFFSHLYKPLGVDDSAEGSMTNVANCDN